MSLPCRSSPRSAFNSQAVSRRRKTGSPFFTEIWNKNMFPRALYVYLKCGQIVMGNAVFL